MAWRLARSLGVLTAEIKAKAPRTTVYNIGDPDHQARSSDHNPNDAGVVCAIDVMPGGGLDLAEFAEEVRQRRHPAGKYVIYQDRIASASREWVWRDHTGEFHEHVHVSVGVGPDGDSTGPYDNTDPWLGDDMEQKERLAYQTSYDARTVGQVLADLSNFRDGLVNKPGAVRPWDKKPYFDAGSVVDLLATAASGYPAMLNRIGAIETALAELKDAPPQPAPIVTDEQLERVLRKVLGGVDGASPPAQG